MANYRNSRGEVVSRCTTIINLLGYNKAMLMAWALKEGDKAKGKQQEACDMGTYVHNLLEAHIKGHDLNDIMKTATFDMLTIGQNALDNFKRWEDAVRPEFIEIEYTIISEEHNWGGTADFIVRIPEETEYNSCIYRPGTYLGDFKTSKGVYREHLIQVAAYIEGIKEMNTYSSSVRDAIVQSNKKIKTIKNLSLNRLELEPEAIIIHINKDITVDESKVIESHIIQPDMLGEALNDWYLALEMNKRKNMFDRYINGLNGFTSRKK